MVFSDGMVHFLKIETKFNKSIPKLSGGFKVTYVCTFEEEKKNPMTSFEGVFG